MYYRNNKKRTIRICRDCMMDYEYCNGKQNARMVYVNSKDEKESYCNFCKTSGHDSLFII